MRSTKLSSSRSTSSSSSTWKTGGEDVAAAARLEMGRGFVSGEYLGRGMPYGITNLS